MRLIVPTEFHPLLASEPFVCAWSGPEFGPAQLERAAPFLARWGTRLGGALVGAYIMRMASNELPASVEALEHECAGADVVVSHPISAAFASIACERLGVPWVVGDLFPMLLPSGSNPMPGMPDLGRRLNRRCWDIGRSPMFDRLSAAKRFKQERRRLGLRTGGWNLVDGRSSPHLNLGLFSAHYVTPQADWPQPYKVVGFTSWGEPPGYTLPEEVTAWLAAGPPPVVVTLGTSGMSPTPNFSWPPPTPSTGTTPEACSWSPLRPTWRHSVRFTTGTGCGRSFRYARCCATPGRSSTPGRMARTPSRSKLAFLRPSARA